MALSEYIRRIGTDSRYRHEVTPVVVAMVDDSNASSLNQYLAQMLEKAFTSLGHRTLRASTDPKEQFAPDATLAVQFRDLGKTRETPPKETVGRFPRDTGRPGEKLRANKKSVVIGSVPQIIGGTNLTDLTRSYEGRHASHFGLIVEGDSNDEALQMGALVVLGSIEGNVGVDKFDSTDSMRVFLFAASRLAFLANAEMVSQREGQQNSAIRFDEWITHPNVQRMQTSSHILSKAKLIWDLQIEKLGLSERQALSIYRTLKTAGLGEGMQWTLAEIHGKPILGVTETGVTKTDTDPRKGNVVPVYGATEFGSVHFILQGYPDGHLTNLFKSRSLNQVKASLKNITADMRSLLLRGQFKSTLTDMIRGKPVWVDHPGSIETHESVLFAMVSAMLESGKFTSFKQILEYIDKGFEKQRILPVIPENMKPGAKSGIHTHNTASSTQNDSNIRIIEADMEGFGFPHSPPCGSREATILLLSALYDSYQRFGNLQEDEVRIINLPGHGSFTFSKKDVASLATEMATHVQWENQVKRY